MQNAKCKMQNMQNAKCTKCEIYKNARYTKLKYAEYTKEAKRTNWGNMQICNYMMNCLNMQNANIELCKTQTN